jgi:alpha-glucosidase
VYTEPTYWHLKSRGFRCNILGLSLLFAALNVVSLAASPEQIIKSPDGNVVVTFEVKDLPEQPACPVYSVAYKGRVIVVDSRLELVIKDGPALEAGLDIISARTSSNNNIWSPVYGERETVRNHYNELVVELRQTKQPDCSLLLTFRAYNEGIAFCYTVPRQKSLRDFIISREKTQFHFTANHTAWSVYSAQGRYAGSKTIVNDRSPSK